MGFAPILTRPLLEPTGSAARVARSRHGAGLHARLGERTDGLVVPRVWPRPKCRKDSPAAALRLPRRASPPYWPFHLGQAYRVRSRLAAGGRWIRTLGPALHTHRFGPPLVGSVRVPFAKTEITLSRPGTERSKPASAAGCTGQPLGAFRWRVTDVAADGAISAHRPTGRRGRCGAHPRRSPTASRNSSKSNPSAWAAPTTH